MLLVEKALAKFAGSYERLYASDYIWVWQALTGVIDFALYSRSGGMWSKRVVKAEKQKASMASDTTACPLFPTPEALSDEDVFDLLLESVHRNALIGVAADAADEEEGIVEDSVYSVLQVLQVEDLRLVQLRNSWSVEEWTGPWSDSSYLWAKYPHVADAACFAPAQDGVFWMQAESGVK